MFKKLKNLIEPSEVLLKKCTKQVKEINKLEEVYKNMTDEELKKAFDTFYLKEDSRESLNNIFAIVRESSSRILGMRHYDVQLIGGLVLNSGDIAEMKTGEGKTLVSTCPAIYNTKNNKKVHIITVNEYLAKRDYELNKPLFDFLGIKSSYISSEMSTLAKRNAYSASIIYGTNSEFGFDYLRDNMVFEYSSVLQKQLDFAIVDEVDSVLIDEARTPLIISGTADINTEFLRVTNAFIPFLKKETDFEIDLKSQQIFLTESGMNKAEKFLRIENLYDSKNSSILHYLTQSLKAHHIMKKDKDYIVRDGVVEIIDQFTGRISEGRRFSNSLHQAIEVKEKVKLNAETVTKATVTYQNYFRLYNKLSGMTGTAYTEKEELLRVYNMQTITIPTNKPIQRIDEVDLIFPTREDKINAIIKKVIEVSKTGQPVLIGTPTIEESEIFDKAFTEVGLKHATLNAKNHQEEASIIELAGQKGAVTIATNMAGRGTDIKLGDGVDELGGLCVIGTSKNENRRIDNQLRGRSGRQGDKGRTQFYLSLEDDLMVRFGAGKMKNILSNDAEIKENGIGTKFLTRIFENAQKNLEGMNSDSRKNLLEYDGVLATRRKIIYKERTDILKSDNPLALYKAFVESQVNSTPTKQNFFSEEDGVQDSFTSILELLSYDSSLSKTEFLDVFFKELDLFISLSNEKYIQEIIRTKILEIIDDKWVIYLDSLDNIKKGIHLQAYGQQNPIRTYEKRADAEFEEMRASFAEELVKNVYYLLKQIYENALMPKIEEEVLLNETE